MRMPQPTATQHTPAMVLTYGDVGSDDYYIMGYSSPSNPASPSDKRPSGGDNQDNAEDKLPEAELAKNKIERVEHLHLPIMDSAIDCDDSDDDSTLSLPALISQGHLSRRLWPMPHKAVSAKSNALNAEVKGVDKEMHTTRDLDDIDDRFRSSRKIIYNKERDRQRRRHTKGACDNSKSTKESTSSKAQDQASANKRTSTKKKWSTVKLFPSVTLDLRDSHADDSATTAPSANVNTPPKSKWVWVDGKGAVQSGSLDRVPATANHVPLNTPMYAYLENVHNMPEPIPFDEFRRLWTVGPLYGGEDQHQKYDRPICVGGWNGCGVPLNCICEKFEAPPLPHGIPYPPNAKEPHKLYYGDARHPCDRTKFGESRMIDRFLEFTNDELSWKEASLFVRMCGANLKVAITMYHNIGGLESVKRVLAAWSSLPAAQEVVEGSKLPDYGAPQSWSGTSFSDDDRKARIPETEPVANVNPVNDNRADAVKSPEPTVQASSTYTVTYWATVESGDKSANIEVKNENVYGKLKAIVEGNAGMKKVWKWVHDKGLIDKVGLQDAFDLAQDMYGDDEPAEVSDDEDGGCSAQAKSKCSSEQGTWGERAMYSSVPVFRSPDPSAHRWSFTKKEAAS